MFHDQILSFILVENKKAICHETQPCLTTNSVTSIFLCSTDKLYVVGGYTSIGSTLSTDGVGINEDRPDAALHINQSDDKGIALQIDLENIPFARRG